MSNIMGYFRKSKNALEKGGITLKNTTEEKVRCPICKSYETRRAIAKQKKWKPSKQRLCLLWAMRIRTLPRKNNLPGI